MTKKLANFDVHFVFALNMVVSQAMALHGELRYPPRSALPCSLLFFSPVMKQDLR